MRIGILTTDTPHHRYFVREVAKGLSGDDRLAFVLFETKPYAWAARARRHLQRTAPNLWIGLARNPYLQSARLSRRIHSFERMQFFPDGDDALPDSIPAISVADVNNAEAAAFLDAHPSDVYFVFGTGLIKPSVYQRPRLGSVNAHGGLLPGYRGLDTNLWAALLDRPEDMAATLHVVAEAFDTGPVLFQDRIAPIAGLDLISLRYHTALSITSMALPLFSAMSAGTARPRPQRGESRYFGWMPHALKLKAGRAIVRYAAGAQGKAA